MPRRYQPRTRRWFARSRPQEMAGDEAMALSIVMAHDCRFPRAPRRQLRDADMMMLRCRHRPFCRCPPRVLLPADDDDRGAALRIFLVTAPRCTMILHGLYDDISSISTVGAIARRGHHDASENISGRLR